MHCQYRKLTLPEALALFESGQNIYAPNDGQDPDAGMIQLGDPIEIELLHDALFCPVPYLEVSA